MPLRINTNLSALNLGRQLSQNVKAVDNSLERLSSGLRINRAADDAAGLSIREGLRAELSGLNVSISNASQASNLVHTAESSLAEVNTVLLRMRELAVQSSSSSLTDSDRSSVQAEFSELTSEIDRIASATVFNSQTLLTGFGNSVDPTSSAVSTSNLTGVNKITLSGAPAGTFTFTDTIGDSELTLSNGTLSQTLDLGTILDEGSVATGTQVIANFDRLGIQVTLAGPQVPEATGDFADGDLNSAEIVVLEGSGGSFQIGSTDNAANRLELSIPDLRATGSELNLSGANVSSRATSQSAITSVDIAITRVAQERGNLGATQNRLHFAVSFTEKAIEKVSAAESSISDADVAAEITKLTRSQLLVQVGTAILAQANVQPQTALLLLSGQGIIPSDRVFPLTPDP